MELAGVSAIVTGGASGLGAATATRLAERGAKVVIADLNDTLGTDLAASIGAAYQRVDVRNTDEVITATDLALSLGELRVLVNCAGIAKPARTIGRGGEYSAAQPLEDFQRIVDVNLVGTFNAVRIAAVAMSRSSELEYGARGVIINTSSMASFEGQVGQASYSASKAAINGMTLPLARDLSSIGVRVNTIAPGLVDTPIYSVVEDPESFKRELARDVLFPRRLGVADEFARLAIELITNDYMNAEVVRLDGGARLRAK